MFYYPIKVQSRPDSVAGNDRAKLYPLGELGSFFVVF
jgi:hypothetical protein